MKIGNSYQIKIKLLKFPSSLGELSRRVMSRASPRHSRSHYCIAPLNISHQKNLQNRDLNLFSSSDYHLLGA